MTFDEKTAQEIINNFNLDKGTLKVWRCRGKIPDKYMNQNFNPEKNRVSAESCKAILEALRLPEINSSRIAPSIPNTSKADWLRGKIEIPKSHATLIKQHLVKIRNNGKKAAAEKGETGLKNCIKFLTSEEIFAFTALKGVTDENTANKIRQTIREKNPSFTLDRQKIIIQATSRIVTLLSDI